MAAWSRSSSRCTNPPGSAHLPRWGSRARWISKTLRFASSRPNTTQSTVSAGRGYSWPAVISAVVQPRSILDLGQLTSESSRQDRETTPGLRVEVLVVEVERRCIALALPLISVEQKEDPLDPLAETSPRILWKARGELGQNVTRDELVPDGQALDHVEHGKRHEIALGRLVAL